MPPEVVCAKVRQLQDSVVRDPGDAVCTLVQRLIVIIVALLAGALRFPIIAIVVPAKTMVPTFLTEFIAKRAAA
jgi:hypothetical protein